MGRDPNMDREDLKNGSRQSDSNSSKRFFARSEFSKSAEFFSKVRLLSLSRLLHHTHLVGFISVK